MSAAGTKSFDYSNAREVFERLNASGIRYVVLRNYENLLTTALCVEGHKDIDILCEDSYELAEALGAKYFTNLAKALNNDGTHFYIRIDGKLIVLDLRHFGDGYYCTPWQQDILEKRVKHDCFWIPDEENLFYSFVYHAILQKPELSDEYRQRLNAMKTKFVAAQEQDKQYDKPEFLAALEAFMKQRSYNYTYPHDVYVPLMTDGIDRGMLEHNWPMRLKHLRYDLKLGLMDLMVKVKHGFKK